MGAGGSINPVTAASIAQSLSQRHEPSQENATSILQHLVGSVQPTPAMFAAAASAVSAVSASTSARSGQQQQQQQTPPAAASTPASGDSSSHNYIVSPALTDPASNATPSSKHTTPHHLNVPSSASARSSAAGVDGGNSDRMPWLVTSPLPQSQHPFTDMVVSSATESGGDGSGLLDGAFSGSFDESLFLEPFSDWPSDFYDLGVERSEFQSLDQIQDALRANYSVSDALMNASSTCCNLDGGGVNLSASTPSMTAAANIEASSTSSSQGSSTAHEKRGSVSQSARWVQDLTAEDREQLMKAIELCSARPMLRHYLHE